MTHSLRGARSSSAWLSCINIAFFPPHKKLRRYNLYASNHLITLTHSLTHLPTATLRQSLTYLPHYNRPLIVCWWRFALTFADRSAHFFTMANFAKSGWKMCLQLRGKLHFSLARVTTHGENKWRKAYAPWWWRCSRWKTDENPRYPSLAKVMRQGREGLPPVGQCQKQYKPLAFLTSGAVGGRANTKKGEGGKGKRTEPSPSQCSSIPHEVRGEWNLNQEYSGGIYSTGERCEAYERVGGVFFPHQWS